MKLILLSNTNFGYNNKRRILNQQLDYFNNFFIPWLENNCEPVDILIHTGNLFSNINIYTLNKVQDIFDRISKIVKVKMLVGNFDRTNDSRDNSINSFVIFKHNSNIEIITDFATHQYIDMDDTALIPWIRIPHDKLTDAHFDNLITSIDISSSPFEFDLIANKVFCGFSTEFSEVGSKIFIGSPYQMNKDQKSEKGFIVVDGGGHKHIKNTYSPTYKNIILENEKDLEDLESKKDIIEKNNITVMVGGELLEKKIKVDMLLSKYKFSEIRYEVKEEPIVIESETVDINKMIEEAIEKSSNKNVLINEYQNILNVFKTKI